jgi:hypothetical protein
MSRHRFAPITSNLLVRKGEAKPWQMPSSDLDGFLDFAPSPQKFAEAPEDDYRLAPDYQRWEKALKPKPVFEAKPAFETKPAFQAKPAIETKPKRHVETVVLDDHGKRCSIKLTHEEYERLGIIAVKKDMSRQQVLRKAIENYLEAARKEFQSQCGCLGGCQGGC